MDGTIYVGVNDDGDLVGVINPDKTLCEIADIITDKILPSAKEYIKASTITIDNKNIIKIEIKKSNQPVHYLESKGISHKGVFLRLGTSNRSMTLEEINNRYIMSLNIKKPSIIEIEAREQELTFSTLKVYLNKFKVHFDEITFEKTYKLKTKDEKYNRLAEIMADENDVDVKVARF